MSSSKRPRAMAQREAGVTGRFYGLCVARR